jgi:hypothetical protein
LSDNDNNDGKVASLVDRLRIRAEEQQTFHAHMGRLSAATRIVAYAVMQMRQEVPGITTDEVAAALKIVAEEMASSGGWAD